MRPDWSTSLLCNFFSKRNFSSDSSIFSWKTNGHKSSNKRIFWRYRKTKQKLKQLPNYLCQMISWKLQYSTWLSSSLPWSLAYIINNQKWNYIECSDWYQTSKGLLIIASTSYRNKAVIFPGCQISSNSCRVFLGDFNPKLICKSTNPTSSSLALSTCLNTKKLLVWKIFLNKWSIRKWQSSNYY